MPTLRADVVVVALDGSGDTTGVQAGFDLAAAGDVVLIRSGNYQPLGPFEPDVLVQIDKPLTVIGDGAPASIGYLRIEDIGPDGRVIIRNLDFSMPFLSSTFFETVRIQDCQGEVLLEDVGIFGTIGVEEGLVGEVGLEVGNCDGVSLTRCTVRGGPGRDTQPPINFFGISPGGPGATITNSKVAFFECDVTGGRGGIDDFFDEGGAAGGPGLVLTGSTVYLAGGTTTGGASSDGCDPGDPGVCAGGDAIVMLGANAVLRTLGAAIAGGLGGMLTNGGTGPDGVEIENPLGIVLPFPEAARGLSLDPVLREGETGTITLQAPVGQLGRIFLAVDTTYAQLGGKKGVYQLGGPTIGPILLGEVPGSGQIDVPLTLPPGALGGADGFMVTFQGYTFGTEGLIFTNGTQTLLAAAGL